MHTSHCAGILLAAGASRRLGYPKQLLQFQGETLLHRTARLALEAGLFPVQVVLGSRAEELRLSIADLPVQIVINEDWAGGMATSLWTGLRTLPRASTHALVLVCDQVALTADQLRQLVEASMAHPDKMIASTYHGNSGVPAIFPAAFFNDLLNIQGDRGARELLRAQSSHVLSLVFDDGAQDIDTAEDATKAGLLHVDPAQIGDKTAESHKK